LGKVGSGGEKSAARRSVEVDLVVVSSWAADLAA
jgi:hypothetical protein